MADILEFSRYAGRPSLDGLSAEKLLERLDFVWAQISRLDEQEPEDMESEEYEDWGDRREELEDLADDIQDRLDELGGHHAHPH